MKNIVILGGRGVMGRIVAHLFRRAGHTVAAFGSRDWDAAPGALAACDVCVVSVPPDITSAIIRKAAAHLKPQAVLMDVTSVKTEPIATMLDAHAGPVLGLHPMFGEGFDTFQGQTVIDCGGRDTEQSAWITGLMRADGATLEAMSPDEHDRTMAYVQSLRFFLMFAWGAFLRGEQVDIDRLERLSSPIHRMNLYEIGRFFNKPGPLYAQIMSLDPIRRDTIRRFIDDLQRCNRMVQSADPAGIEACMDEIRTGLGVFCEKSQKKSDLLIETLLADAASDVFRAAHTAPQCCGGHVPCVTGERTVARGKWMEFREAAWLDREGTPRAWEFVTRGRKFDAVVTIPWLMPSERLVFIRQYRVPMDAYLIEFPAGLIPPEESAEAGALRELREETGYAGRIVSLTPPSYSSPGLTDEAVRQALVHIDETAPENRNPVAAPEGSESITVHAVAKNEIAAFLRKSRAEGCRLDSKVVSYCLGMGVDIG